MKVALCAVAVLLAITSPSFADGPGFQDPLLDKLVGTCDIERDGERTEFARVSVMRE